MPSEGTQVATNGSDSNSIYARILADIGAGHFSADTRLKVQDLANRYGTSIIPVREALRLLQGEGIVTIEQNKGATVSSFDADSLRDIFEILQLMEPYFVETFAKSCTEADIAQLEEIQAQIEKISVGDKPTFANLDKQFHALIAKKHYNTRAYAIWELQRRILNALAMNVSISKSRHADILKEHQELISAFRDGDTERAIKCIKQHVGGAGDQMYLQLKSSTS